MLTVNIQYYIHIGILCINIISINKSLIYVNVNCHLPVVMTADFTAAGDQSGYSDLIRDTTPET